MSKYTRGKVNINNNDSPLVKIIGLTNPNSKILDFGCSSGYLAKYLKENLNCRVIGLELDKKNAQVARRYCEKVINCDIENYSWEKNLGKQKFDIAIFADVLEHLKKPENILKRVKKFLKKDGYILISLPNIAHVSIRLKLLTGNFDYEKSGILDDTHLKFFTKKTALELIQNSGYSINAINIVPKDIDYALITKYLSAVGLEYNGKVEKFFHLPEARAFQFVIKATLNFKNLKT